MQVIVLDANKKPLAPTTSRRADMLLDRKKAAVFRTFPFTIILKREVEDVTPTFVVKLDPGSKKTGIVVINQQTGQIVFACELEHRGQQVKANLESRRSLRSGRRNRKTRYRQPRFLNRTRKPGWLPPSLESRLSNTTTWVKRLLKWFPVAGIAVEDVKFDTQLLENPDIAGIEYQQGTLAGYELREFVLTRDNHKCCYCGAKNVPLQLDHIIPKSRGGHNRPSNLCAACERCNQKKNNLTAAEFGFPKLQEQVAKGLKDAAAVNASRKELVKRLRAIGLPVETGSGGLTKFNRTTRALPKTHWLDAANVGASTPVKLILPDRVLLVRAIGHGSRQMCRTDKFGFPKVHLERKKTFQGWQTGDIVRAVVPKGVHRGTFTGRLTIRQKPTFAIGKRDVHLKYLTRLHRRDGYGYEQLCADKQMALAGYLVTNALVVRLMSS